MRSMTGFGRGEIETADYKITVELKTVNHRYLDINIRLPQVLSSMEDKIRKFMSASLCRGRSDIFVSLQEKAAAGRQILVDKELAIAYHNALRDLSNSLYLPEPVDVYQIAQQPGVVTFLNAGYDDIQLWQDLQQALGQALEQLLTMRRIEGSNMARDLNERIEKLHNIVEDVEKCAPVVIAEYRSRLKERLSQLLPDEIKLDETRIIQETALFADRVNFTEEIVRLRSHLGQFRKTIMSDEASIGRKLDFIVQEMNRETNTIASKANDFEITNLTVEAKSEIEKIREQIQNIE